MKDELQDKLVEILSAIQSATGKAADFALEQLPDIAQQYVMYGRAWNTLAVALLVTVAVLAIWRFQVNHKNFEQDPGFEFIRGRSDRQVFAMSGYVMTAVGSLVASFHYASTALLVWFAPKVWLLKELAALVK